jgi:hypothetical protein
MCLLLLLRGLAVQTLVFLRILPLRVPLTGLQDQDAHQDQGQDRITCRENLQTVFAAKNLLSFLR